MHAFQKVDIDQFEVNPFDKIGKDWMLVTAGNEEKANTMTASWGGMGVMWGKNVVFVFIRDSRFTKEFIDREGRFSLSFPSEEYRKEMKTRSKRRAFMQRIMMVCHTLMREKKFFFVV